MSDKKQHADSDGRAESLWIGFDLGGTKMLSVVFDQTMQRLGQKRRRTRGREGVKVGVKRILQTIEQSLEDAGRDIDDVRGVVLGCPGPVDPSSGRVLEMVNLGWNDVPLRDILREELGKPAVVLNDVTLASTANTSRAPPLAPKPHLACFPERGSAAGACFGVRSCAALDSRPWRSATFKSNPRENTADAAGRDAWKPRASRLAIAGRAAQAAYRGAAPFLAKEVGCDISDIRSSLLAKSIKHGDEAVELIVRQAARDLGVAVANFVHLVAPDVVVLGGGMVEAMRSLWLEEVTSTARSRVMTAYRDSFQVVVAELGDYASVTGAAAWARKSPPPVDVTSTLSEPLEPAEPS